MSNAPVTQSEIEAIRTSFRTERVLEILHKLSRMTPVELDDAMADMSILRVCQFDILLRAIAERDATEQMLRRELAARDRGLAIAGDCYRELFNASEKLRDDLTEQTLRTRDAREDHANYRASAEEQIAQLRQQLDAREQQLEQRNADLRLISESRDKHQEFIEGLKRQLAGSRHDCEMLRQAASELSLQLAAVTAERDALLPYKAALQGIPEVAITFGGWNITGYTDALKRDMAALRAKENGND